MSKPWNTRSAQALWASILTLKTPGEAALFFRDLLTVPEIVELSNRWQAAQMLDRKIPYTAISATTGLSSRTVARIARWLNRGMNGYRLVLARQHHAHPARSRQR